MFSKMLFTQLTVVLVSVVLTHCFFLSPQVIPGESGCPSQGTVDAVTASIHAAVSNILQNTVSSLPQCGAGRWYKVVTLDAATDGCPSPWSLQSSDGQPVCGRGDVLSASGSCVGLTFSTGGLNYSSVCGKITGRSSITPDALGGFGPVTPETIDDPYVDGVSITHSTPRVHIWTFAVNAQLPTDCPCSTGAIPEVSFVGSDYFCDYDPDPADRLVWDGQECTEDTALTCCDFNSPPYFSTTLTQPTTADIEVRICTDESTLNEDVVIQNMELYIQ